MSKKIILVFILILYSLSLCNSLQAQTIVYINDSIDEHMFMGTDQMVLEDSKSQYSFDEVTTVLHDKFEMNYLFAPHNTNRASTYWIRIRIKENSESEKQWMLELFDQTIDLIEAYLPQSSGAYTHMIMGDKMPFNNRRFAHKNFEIKIPNTSNGIKEIYFKIHASHHVNIIIVLRSVEKLIYYGLNEYLIFGLFYGMILVVSIYNLLMYFAIREGEYLVYILYILSVGLYTACSDGLAFQYLWPNHPAWNNLSSGVSLYCVILWAMIFTKMFLRSDTTYPKLDRIINIVIVIRTIIFAIAVLFFHKLLEYRWIEFLPLLVVFVSGIYSYANGFKAARFFFLAYALMVVAFMIKVIINLDLGFIPGTILTHYSVNIGFWFEMVLLSFALGDKVRIIKDTKDGALREIIAQHEVNQNLKDKVTKELEEEVEKRTEEISAQKEIIEKQYEEIKVANEKLIEQAREINDINALLDLDNYKLQRKVNEEMLARVGSKSMEYEDFRKIFPDEMACLRYLEKKWEKGYICKKCGNAKNLLGKSIFDRRCSRCGYNESPTAFTIFQGTRFPLEKAFYILHLVISDREDITIDELSRTLELRRNTCWAFKDKVTRIIKNNKPKRGHLDWDTVVFNLNLYKEP